MADYGYSVALSSDGSVLAVATFVSSPYVKVYDWTGTEWTAKPTPPGLPSMILTVALSPDGGVLAIGASGNSPYVKVYTSNEATSTTVQFNTAPAIGEIITADYTVKGVHKTDQYVIDVSFAIQFGEGV
jgi:WD40 repeat protein